MSEVAIAADATVVSAVTVGATTIRFGVFDTDVVAEVRFNCKAGTICAANKFRTGNAVAGADDVETGREAPNRSVIRTPTGAIDFPLSIDYMEGWTMEMLVFGTDTGICIELGVEVITVFVTDIADGLAAVDVVFKRSSFVSIGINTTNSLPSIDFCRVLLKPSDPIK